MLRIWRWSYFYVTVTTLLFFLLSSELLNLRKSLYNRGALRLNTNSSIASTHFFNLDEVSTPVKVTQQPQQKVKSFTKRMLQNDKPFIQTGDTRVYLYSAIGVNNKTPINKNIRHFDHSSIVLTGWEHKLIVKKDFTCCYMLNNDTIVSKVSTNKRNWSYLGKAPLQAKQYTCPAVIDKKFIKGISVSMKVLSCSSSKADYLTPAFPPHQNRTSIAICSKLAYGNLSSSRLVEWFEAHKLFGVNKVLAYLYTNLNADARRVFDYYVSTGMAELLDFDLPEKGSVKRDVGVKNMQSWNDEQIVAYDCQIRLHGYQYVGVVDTDEFMVPVTNTYNNSWITYLDPVFRKKRISGISFPVQVHATTWGPVNITSKLLIGQYLNSTLAIFDRIKNIYMPSRVQIGTVSTHSFKGLKGFNRYIALKKDATLHHYRTCRKEWLRTSHKINIDDKEKLAQAKVYNFKSDQKCYDLQRYTSDAMSSIANILEPAVVKLGQQLNIKMSK